ncbi:pyocin S6 family toxin immunity protein [Pseudomonas graminis]|uniref:Uncharacterized protein n=1 Tax=Pseudomonas graminis TaxID=158627 RepID=A0A1C2EBV6_9PSED|nr:pyocin S6 family toxin immunity protein [Pseudomonas graminis]OCX24542.1 hypothetical protein BBI10_04710 [Pseudomonas graminis]
MAFMLIQGFYPEPDPDNSLQYEKVVPQALETNVLAAMGWTTKSDVPPGVTELSQEQAVMVLKALDERKKAQLIYCIALYRNEPAS